MYQASTLSKSCACRKHMEDMDNLLERFHGFAVILSKSSQGPSLMLENFHNRVNSMAIIKLPGEGMVDQIQPRVFLIALEGSVKEQPKPSTRRIVHCMIQMEEVCREVEN